MEICCKESLYYLELNLKTIGIELNKQEKALFKIGYNTGYRNANLNYEEQLIANDILELYPKYKLKLKL